MGAHLRNFVEEDRAFIGKLEFPGFRTNRASEGALFESEQLGFQQFSGQRSAIDLDKSLAAARGSHVNHARNHFLAYSALSVNEHRDVHRRNLENLLADAHHLRTCGQEADIFRDRVAILPERLVFRPKLLFLPALQDRYIEFGFFERFGQVILRAQANGLHHGPYLIRTGQHDDVERPVDLHQLFQRLKTTQFRHQYVQNNEIRTLARFDLFDCLDAGDHGIDLVAIDLQQRSQILPDARFVVYD